MLQYSRTVPALMCMSFSLSAVYDTHAIMKRLSPDEYIMGALSLYLDFINLFLYILRVVSVRQGHDA
jgi:protein lifeguard